MKVLLISDISRGGIFASLYGTINLMSKEEQSLIKGIIINKFKGDIKYFVPIYILNNTLLDCVRVW